MAPCKPSDICTMISFMSRFYMFPDVLAPLCDPGTSTAAWHLMFKYTLMVCFLSNRGRKIYISIVHACTIHSENAFIWGGGGSISWKWCHCSGTLFVCQLPSHTAAPHNYSLHMAKPVMSIASCFIIYVALIYNSLWIIYTSLRV